MYYQKVVYQISIAVGFYLSLVIIFISSIPPAVVSGIIFWKKRTALFSVVMVLASVVMIFWIWAFVLGQFSTIF